MINFKTKSAEFIKALKKYSNILIVIKGSPDPDAIASSYAVKLICDNLAINSKIICFQKISLNQNSEMVKILNIPVFYSDTIEVSSNFDAFVLTDHQSAGYMGISNLLPCAAHIDHHQIFDDGVNPDFRLRMQDAGSTASIIAFLAAESQLNIDSDSMMRMSTALIIGIQTDTDKYNHAGELDFKALNYLSKYSNTELLNQISNTAISDYTLNILNKAIDNKIIYKDWTISGVGFVEEENRDSIAIAADYLLKNNETETVIVFAAIENDKHLFIDASFRSTKENLNLNVIIKEITNDGGARKYKGAYQVSIDYFKYCPDRDLLWKIIELTTHEVIRQKRDGVYIMELKGLYKTVKDKFLNFFR